MRVGLYTSYLICTIVLVLTLLVHKPLAAADLVGVSVSDTTSKPILCIKNGSQHGAAKLSANGNLLPHQVTLGKLKQKGLGLGNRVFRLRKEDRLCRRQIKRQRVLFVGTENNPNLCSEVNLVSDTVIDLRDLHAFLREYGRQFSAQLDFHHDQVINTSDLSLLLSCIGMRLLSTSSSSSASNSSPVGTNSSQTTSSSSQSTSTSSQTSSASSQGTSTSLQSSSTTSNLTSHSSSSSSNGNRPPTAIPQILSTGVNQNIQITLRGTDPDPNTTLRFAITTPPQNGTLTGSDAERMYSPELNYRGQDFFYFTVTDGQITSEPARVDLYVGVAPPWRAPIGIPVPPFGILERAPAIPAPWNSVVPGYYYVMQNSTACRDTINGVPNNGTPTLPRCTIPSTLSAGSVVILSGTYQTPGPYIVIQANGTLQSPVYIRGENPGNPPVVGGHKWALHGSYYIVENILFDWVNSPNGKIEMNGDSGVFRFNEQNGRGRSGVGSIFPGGTRHVIYANSLHDGGLYTASNDDDTHGISPNNISRLWILDNYIARYSGNGFQLNAGSIQNQPNINHIYVGRNEFDSTRQPGGGIKQSVDVIISENKVHGIRFCGPCGSVIGAGFGFQYAPHYLSFLFNEIWDSQAGIKGVSADHGFGEYSFFIGNVIHDLQVPTSGYNVNSAWSPGAISLPGGVRYKYILGNTLYNVPMGIATESGEIFAHNNIVSNITVPGSSALFVDNSGAAIPHDLKANLLFPGPNAHALRIGNNTSSVPTPGCPTCFTANPRFSDPTQGNFRLESNSPAIDAGTNELIEEIAELFLTRYGVDIKYDLDRVSRPQSDRWDIGAFEYLP